MVNVKFKKWLAACIVSMGIVCSAGVTAFAYTGEGTPTEQGTEAPTPIPEQTPAPQEGQTEEGTPFSVPGNGQILDDKNNDSTKQFLTVQTKNGNTFFLVLDRSSSTENVYMLSMVDENDLAEFVPEKKPQTAPPSVVIPETEKKPEAEKPEKKADKAENQTGALLAIGLLAAGGAGAYYYFKVAKPKKAETDAEDEDLEFYNGPYINEDAEDAEEIVQETFIKLWETRDKIKVELNFNTYITTIAKNLIYDMFRKKLVEQRYYQKFQSLIQEQLAVENELFRKNLQEVMFDSINKLSEQQREVMMLKCKGFNNDEIAELLGISKRTVEAHLNKAYKKLRQDLGEVRYYSFLLFF